MRVLGIILLALLLLGLLPVGIEAEAAGQSALLRVKIGPVGLRLYPAPPQKKKAPRRRGKKLEPEEEAPAEETRGRRGGLGLGPRDLPELWRLLRRLLGRFRRSLCIRELTVHLVLGGADGGGAVLVYGWANALRSTLSPAFHRAFRVRREDVQLAVDFELEEPVWELRLAVSIRIGQIVWIVAASGFEALFWLLRRRRQARRAARAAKKTETEAAEAAGTEDRETEYQGTEYQGTERG